MREIKFRAWDQVKKIMTLDAIVISGIRLDVYIPQAREGVIWMQFTGLLDKSGKEIYEGDILLCGDGGENFSQKYDEEKDEYFSTHKAKVIGPTDTYPAFEIEPNPCDGCNGLSQLIATGEMEVIGNIHENPELLK